MEVGQDVWWDQWEILAGDSLIRKIFAEGLAGAQAFAILLSPASVRSKWVQEELDTATLRRIEDLTRVIPVLIADVEVPLPLRTLRWVDMRADFAAGVRAILNAIHGVSEKPPLADLPDHIRKMGDTIGGLSRLASTIGLQLLRASDPDSDQERAFVGSELATELKLSPEELNDAIDELESNGIVRLIRALGTGPYDFAAVEPTYLLYHTFSESLPYRPLDDVRAAIAAVVALGSATGEALQKHTSLSPGRLNKAVEFIRERGLADVGYYLGTHPFSFGLVTATRNTRQAAARRE